MGVAPMAARSLSPRAEAAMAYGLRRMGVAAEVSAFERKVCGHQYFASWWRAQDRAIVAYAELDRAAAGGKIAPNLLDQA
ncbi:hypothetical protein RBB78_21850 [Tunturiibacter empetritectus]|uniref:hypothetical protein n=1 Tax=Tunturiibacter empetritectus TaxID=3069691 RepID=UPI003D9ADBA9